MWVMFSSFGLVVMQERGIFARVLGRRGRGHHGLHQVWKGQGSCGGRVQAALLPPRAAKLCTVSAPFPRHQGTPVADTMALGFPWAGSGYCHQACQEIAADTRGRAWGWAQGVGGPDHAVGEF